MDDFLNDHGPSGQKRVILNQQCLGIYSVCSLHPHMLFLLLPVCWEREFSGVFSYKDAKPIGSGHAYAPFNLITSFFQLKILELYKNFKIRIAHI